MANAARGKQGRVGHSCEQRCTHACVSDDGQLEALRVPRKAGPCRGSLRPPGQTASRVHAGSKPPMSGADRCPCQHMSSELRRGSGLSRGAQAGRRCCTGQQPGLFFFFTGPSAGSGHQSRTRLGRRLLDAPGEAGRGERRQVQRGQLRHSRLPADRTAHVRGWEDCGGRAKQGRPCILGPAVPQLEHTGRGKPQNQARQ